MKTRRKKINYVNNNDLYSDLVIYYKSKKAGDDPQISRYVGQCILQIANRLAMRPNFINYTYREEMVSDGIERCVSACRTFNPNKSKNPFGFFTQIIWNAFIKRIGDEKKQHAIKHKNHLRNHLFDSSVEVNDVTDNVIEAYEKTLQNRKDALTNQPKSVTMKRKSKKK
jgi:DNA-directed RNA polymerase specialized sigma24 family protein